MFDVLHVEAVVTYGDDKVKTIEEYQKKARNVRCDPRIPLISKLKVENGKLKVKVISSSFAFFHL